MGYIRQDKLPKLKEYKYSSTSRIYPRPPFAAHRKTPPD